MRRLPTSIASALTKAGAVLARQRKHLVFRLANGKSVTMASTPSDYRAEQNVLRDIRSATGEPRSLPSIGTRVRMPPKPGRQKAPSVMPALSPMSAALLQSGLIEQQLRARITELEGALAASEQAQCTIEQSWLLRVDRWTRRFVNRLTSKGARLAVPRSGKS